VEGAGEKEGQYPFEVFQFPPCPEGNDRFEPNNSQQQAAGITPDKVPIRHLRLCGDDQDWFRLTLPPSEDDEESASTQSDDPGDDEEPEPEAFSAVAHYEGAERDVIVELYSAETGKRIASSEDMQTQQTNADADDGQTAVATMLEPETSEIVVRVQGDPGYYHLSFPETEARQQQQQQSGGGQQDEDSQQNADQEQQEQDGQQQDQEQQQQDAADDEPSEDQQPQPGEEQREDEAAQSPSEPSDEQAEREALMQLLDSLEDEDVNLQLRQALDDIPPTQMRNEW
jgi:hypothetical protein